MAQVIQTKGPLVRVDRPLEESASSSIVILDNKTAKTNDQNQAIDSKVVKNRG